MFSESLNSKIVPDFWTDFNLDPKIWIFQLRLEERLKLDPDQKSNKILETSDPEDPRFSTLFDFSKKSNFAHFMSKPGILGFYSGMNQKSDNISNQRPKKSQFW